MPVATDLPGKLTFRWYSYNAHTIVFAWPYSMTGSTVVFRRPGTTDIAVDVADDVLTVEVPPITKTALTQDWSLVDITSDDVTLLGGKVMWALSYDDSPDSTEVAVTLNTEDVTVTVNTGTIIFGTSIDGGSFAATGPASLDGGSL